MPANDEQQRDGGAIGRGAIPMRDALLGYFRRRLRNQDDAEDLVQDTFARVAARDSTQPIENLRGYLFRTAASVLSDWARARRASRVGDHVEFDPAMHGGVDLDAERILCGREDLRITLEALLALPERTRTVFILFKVEGMSQRDIARQLGISISAVEKHVMRAVQHVAATLKEHI